MTDKNFDIIQTKLGFVNDKLARMIEAVCDLSYIVPSTKAAHLKKIKDYAFDLRSVLLSCHETMDKQHKDLLVVYSLLKQ